MKLLNTFLKKISKQNFSKLYKSLGTFNLIASNLSNNDDIFNALYVLAFDEIPNTKFTVKESITRKSDAKEQLNLVEKHIIAKEVLKSFEDKDSVYDPELKNHVKVDANFKQPTDAFLVKTAKFGDVALIDNKYHLVNPLTKKVTAEYIVLAADANFAKLHELIAKYRDEKDVKLTELDGQMVLTGTPEVINELEHLVKDTGYYCESVNESTGVDGEIPEYSLKIFTNTTAAPEFDIEKAAAKHEQVGEDSKFSYWLQLEDNYEDEGYLDSKKVGDHIGFFYVTEKGTQAPALLVSQLGFSGDGLTAQRTYPMKSNEPGKTYLYEEYGYTDDDFAEVYNFLNDGLKNVSPEMNKKNLDGLTVDNIDVKNPNLEKDNPMLNTEGAVEEVVEKTSEEKLSVEKKAEDEKAQAVKQLTGEDAELTEWTTYGLPTYKSGDEEYAVASNEQEVYNAVVEEVESIFNDVGYDAFNWDNMGGIENFVSSEWFDDAHLESNVSYAEDIYKSDVSRFKEEATELGLDINSPEYNLDELGDHSKAFEDFALRMKRSEGNSVKWFIDNFGKDAFKDVVKSGKVYVDLKAVADEVINLDGAGHVLSIYDGNEVEQQVNGKTYFLYRQAKKQDGLNKKADATDLSFDEAMALDKSDPQAVEYLAKNFSVQTETAKRILNSASNVYEAYMRMNIISDRLGYGWDTNPDSDAPTMQQVLDSSEENIEKNSAKKKTPEWMVKLPKEMVKKIQDAEYLVQKDSEEFKALDAIPDSLTQDMFDENLFHATSPSVIAKYQPFMTVDASEEGTIKIYSGDHFIGTCKTIQAAFEKVADEEQEEPKTYTFDELSPEAKDVAIERAGNLYMDMFWDNLDEYITDFFNTNNEFSKYTIDFDTVDISATVPGGYNHAVGTASLKDGRLGTSFKNIIKPVVERVINDVAKESSYVSKHLNDYINLGLGDMYWDGDSFTPYQGFEVISDVPSGLSLQIAEALNEEAVPQIETALEEISNGITKYIENIEKYAYSEDYAMEDAQFNNERFYEDGNIAGYGVQAQEDRKAKTVKSKLLKTKQSEVKKEAGESYGWVVNSEDAWDKLMLWEETVGAEQALRDLAKSMGDEELSDNLAYIFRMNDFKEGCSDADEDNYVESAKEENIDKKADENTFTPSYPDRVGDDITDYQIFPHLGDEYNSGSWNDKYFRPEFKDIPTLDEAKNILFNFDPTVYKNYDEKGNTPLILRIYKCRDSYVYPTEFARIIKVNSDYDQDSYNELEELELLSSKKENIEKKADEELKQFDMKQELDGQKEFEKQDDFSQVSIPEEKEDTSEVTETMEAKPEAPKGESFSASEFGNNLAYIQQNNPDSFSKIMNNLKQLMVGDEKNIYNFLENWSKRNFQDFTAMTREDPTYARHSQYQEQLKNNVLPKLKEMSEYKQAMEEKVSAEKGE